MSQINTHIPPPHLDPQMMLGPPPPIQEGNMMAPPGFGPPGTQGWGSNEDFSTGNVFIA